MSEPRLIKKYPNRRLYDTELSRYITIDDVRGLIAARTQPRIIEQRSGRDITRSVLLQVIAEQEQGSDASREQSIATKAVEARQVRIRLRVPSGAVAGLSEVKVAGALRND